MLYLRKTRVQRTCAYCGKTILPNQDRFQCNCFNTEKDKNLCRTCVEKFITDAIKFKGVEQ